MTRSQKQIIHFESNKKVNIFKAKKSLDESQLLGRISLGLLIVFLIFCVSFAVAHAESDEVGFVICTQASLRETADPNAPSIGRLRNGEIVVICGSTGEFYSVIRKEKYEDGVRNPEGYVFSKYILEGEKANVTMYRDTDFYQFPGSTKALGAKSSGKSRVVIGEYQDYWIIQVPDSTGGAGYVKKIDVSEPYVEEGDKAFYKLVKGTSYEKPAAKLGSTDIKKAKVIFDGAEVRSAPDDSKKPLNKTLPLGKEVEVVEYNDYYVKIRINYGGIPVDVYVHSSDLLLIAE